MEVRWLLHRWKPKVTTSPYSRNARQQMLLQRSHYENLCLEQRPQSLVPTTVLVMVAVKTGFYAFVMKAPPLSGLERTVRFLSTAVVSLMNATPEEVVESVTTERVYAILDGAVNHAGSLIWTVRETVPSTVCVTVTLARVTAILKEAIKATIAQLISASHHHVCMAGELPAKDSSASVIWVREERFDQL